MKKILILIIALLFLPDVSLASEQINIKEFAGEIKNYSNEIFPEFSEENWISEVMSRQDGIRRTRCF